MGPQTAFPQRMRITIPGYDLMVGSNLREGWLCTSTWNRSTFGALTLDLDSKIRGLYKSCRGIAYREHPLSGPQTWDTKTPCAHLASSAVRARKQGGELALAVQETETYRTLGP